MTEECQSIFKLNTHLNWLGINEKPCINGPNVGYQLNNAKGTVLKTKIATV